MTTTRLAPPAALADATYRTSRLGELKNQLFEVLNTQLSPLRKRYNALMDPDSELDALLTAGAEKARKLMG